MTFGSGKKMVLGGAPVLPLRGFPAGRARIRQRPYAFTAVFVRLADGSGIRKFFVEERDGAWWPAYEAAANYTARR